MDWEKRCWREIINARGVNAELNSKPSDTQPAARSVSGLVCGLGVNVVRSGFFRCKHSVCRNLSQMCQFFRGMRTSLPSFTFSGRSDPVHASQVVRHAHKIPFDIRPEQATQTELPKLHDILDHPEYGFDRRLAFGVNALAVRGAHAQRHVLHRIASGPRRLQVIV